MRTWEFLILGYCHFFYHNRCFHFFFCFKNIPTLHGTNAKAYFKSTETTFVLFLCFSLINCRAGMCGLNQRHRTKEQMTILFAVIDIKDLLWAFQAVHLHCCFHPSVDLYVHRSWDTGGRVCVNRRIKSKCYCSCRSAPLCIGQQIETMRWWEKDGVRERQRGQNERLGEVVCLERSGLGAI